MVHVVEPRREAEVVNVSRQRHAFGVQEASSGPRHLLEVEGSVVQVESIGVRLLHGNLDAVAGLEPEVPPERLGDPALPVHFDDQVDRRLFIRPQHVGGALGLVIRHVEVEVTVCVHVCERSARAAELRCQSGGLGNLLERAVSSVPEERVRTSECSNEEIQATVAIDVREGGTGRIAVRRADASRFGHFLEAPTAQVSVQGIATLESRKVEVWATVAVIVPDRDTRPHQQVVVLQRGGRRQSVLEGDIGPPSAHRREAGPSPSGHRELPPAIAVRLGPIRKDLGRAPSENEEE